jgi:predicted dehydrogenase
MTSAGALAAQVAPSKQVVVGVIGSGGRGQFLITTFRRDPGIRIAAVCDVYEPNLENGLSSAGGGAKAYRNYKALLDQKDIEAVIIATPEHWHHRMVLDALAAGKDIYVEKPLCRTPEEGVEIVEAARASRNIVQVGMQRRSYDLYLKARDIKRSGQLGAVRMVRAWWLNNSIRSYKIPPLKGPLDWEQWQGPAARRSLDPARFYDWRSFSEYSGGIVADQGAHVYDGIHLIMDAAFPTAVNASAGRIHKPRVDTPESVVVAAEYPDDFVAVFMINYAAMTYRTRNDQLNQFDGDEARMDVGREQLAVYGQGAEEEPPSVTASGKFASAADAHVANFLDCVRNHTTPNGTVEKGFQAALVVQMANLSLRQGRRLRWNDEFKRVEAYA